MPTSSCADRPTASTRTSSRAFATERDVIAASPVVEIDARLPARDDTLALAGVDAFRAAAVTPALVGRGAAAVDLLRDDRAFLSPAALAMIGRAVGDTLDVQAGTGVATFTIAGTLDAPAGRRLAVVDIAAAQERFGRLGRVSRVDVRVRPGADVDAVRASIAAALPAGVTVVRPGETRRSRRA
jgi:putative ABC transport system permease protein